MFEKVSPQHPDKMCDRLAGAIVDVAYSRVENPKIAVEVLAGHGKVYVMIETSLTQVLSPLWQGGGYKAGVEMLN